MPLYPAEVVKPMIKTLKSLQDVLGRHQDREVQAATLSSLREEVASALPGGAAGADGDGAAGRARWARTSAPRAGSSRDVFAAFAAKGSGGLVKETFG